MKILRILRSETSRLLLLGFVLGGAGVMIAQPGNAQASQQAAANNPYAVTATR
ncbi:MAG: hypothetical protein MUF41_05645 [Sphingopyxis sp.]|jgi:hypothetical protein|nr:hypothetical protein [Sphingopyxis sp.]